MSGRQLALYRAADAAGFATVWHDEAVEAPVRGPWARLLARIAGLFG